MKARTAALLTLLFLANAAFPILLVADDATWRIIGEVHESPLAYSFGEFLRWSPYPFWILVVTAAIHVLASVVAVRSRRSYVAVLVLTAVSVVGSAVSFGLWEQSLSDKGGSTLNPEFILIVLLILLATPTIKYWMVRGVYWVRGVDVP